MIHSILVFVALCLPAATGTFKTQTDTIDFHTDRPFIQDYSIKYYLQKGDAKLLGVCSDRNGFISVFSSDGLLRTRAGQFLFPGLLVADISDRPVADKKVRAVTIYDKQFVYLDEKAVFSNAWAGKLYLKHNLPGAYIVSAGKSFSFLISDGRNLEFLDHSGNSWRGKLSSDTVTSIEFDAADNRFLITGKSAVWSFIPDEKKLIRLASISGLTCLAATDENIYAGCNDGYFIIDPHTGKHKGSKITRMPWPELTVIREIDGRMWFGSSAGAFRLRNDGSFEYFASKRWLPSDKVIDIAAGPDKSVLILTDEGLGKIVSEKMTLYDKAAFFEKQVRERHIRTGFNATLSGLTDGDVTTGSLEDSDNDGLWTAMYLAAETFRYAVTHDDDALLNISESLEAMERLYTINDIPGFPSRSFNRHGYKDEDKPWRRSADPEWDWKSTTSSDEAIGHMFAFGVIAELADSPAIREKAVVLMDTLMSHIVKNDFYMIDWDGQPTRWGRWNPEYVNARPEMVGDRKINSSNIISMLQTAYHFTGRSKYHDAAFQLMNKYGYLGNLMRPMSEIGTAPPEADILSRELSDAWNHSDDEMYYCGYWGLYRYAFNDTLKIKYRDAIIDHWKAERPEKEGLWNIMTALADVPGSDIGNAVRYLQEYPLDLTDWSIVNSNRKDIDTIPSNFRRQTVREVLPPDELRISRHNANRFDLDGYGEGKAEFSAGDIWLLPYWMGRFLGVISGPVSE